MSATERQCLGLGLDSICPNAPFDKIISATGEEGAMTCVYRKLNPDVVVMKSAEDRSRFDGSNPLNHARNRRVFI
jgi:hypothetical protein